MRIRQYGMTMVEIMVAVAIGLIGILIITQAYVTSDRFNRSTLGEGGAQTNGLLALYSVERDVRSAGYGISDLATLGCNQIYWHYNGSDSANIGGGTLQNVTVAPVLITRDTVAPVDIEPVTLTIMYATNPRRMMPSAITNFNKAASEVTLDGVTGFLPGDAVLIVGASGCTLGEITVVLAGSQKIQLLPDVVAPYNPAAWGNFPTNYAGGDLLMNLGNPIVRAYSIGSGKLQVADGLLQSGIATTQELVDGIVDLRAQYGHDTDGNDAVDTWNSTTPTTGLGWSRVYAVRLGVLSRIGNYEKPSGANCDATTVTPTWSGSGTAADAFNKLDFATPASQDRCYRYRVFETTIPLRNMIWRAT
jgi:type IV pilus assembly protein PilW